MNKILFAMCLFSLSSTTFGQTLDERQSLPLEESLSTITPANGGYLVKVTTQKDLSLQENPVVYKDLLPSEHASEPVCSSVFHQLIVEKQQGIKKINSNSEFYIDRISDNKLSSLFANSAQIKSLTLSWNWDEKEVLSLSASELNEVCAGTLRFEVVPAIHVEEALNIGQKNDSSQNVFRILPKSHLNCIPLTANQPIPFIATGVSKNNVNLAFGRLPNGQQIGQVVVSGVAHHVAGGIQFSGSSNATGSTISITLENSNMNRYLQDHSYFQYPQARGTTEDTTSLSGFIQISQYEMQLAGLSDQDCVSGIGASGALNHAYGRFYGGANDYVYVYLNNGQTYIKFKI